MMNGTDRRSRAGRLREPLLKVGGPLGGDWVGAPHSLSTAE